MGNRVALERLVIMATRLGLRSFELALRLDIDPDRLNNGGIREVLELALIDDDPEWIMHQMES
mgnify:CR=1 FL=1